MIFNDDFLKTLGAWQNGWGEIQTDRLELAKKMLNIASSLPVKYRKVSGPCYRKRFLHQGELVDIIMNDEKEESLTSWTVLPEFAQKFKGLQRPGAVTAAIFEHMPEADEVVLNICELWRCKSFIKAAEEYRQNGGENSKAIFNFKADQGEVILNAPLRGTEIVALTGVSSPFDELCDMANIPETERDYYYRKLADLGRFPESPTYIFNANAQRTVQNTIKAMKEKIKRAGATRGYREQ